MVWWLRPQSLGGAAVRGTIVYKMTGSGNDFVLLDGRSTTPAEWPAARIVSSAIGVPASARTVSSFSRPTGPAPCAWRSGTRTGPARTCAATRRSAARRLSVYLELIAPGDLRLLTDAGMVEARCPDRATRPRSACRTSIWPRPTACRRVELDGRRALDGIRHRGGAAPGHPGGRHRGGRSARPGRGAPVRSSARRGRGQRELRGRPGRARRALAHPDLRARRGGRDAGVRHRYGRGGGGPGRPRGGRSAGAVPEQGGRGARGAGRAGGSRASEVWLGGQGKLVFRAVWEA